MARENSAKSGGRSLPLQVCDAENQQDSSLRRFPRPREPDVMIPGCPGLRAFAIRGLAPAAEAAERCRGFENVAHPGLNSAEVLVQKLGPVSPTSRGLWTDRRLQDAISPRAARNRYH
jgi:hypothetical protein